MELNRLTDWEIMLTHNSERTLLESERIIAQAQLDADKAQIQPLIDEASVKVIQTYEEFIEWADEDCELHMGFTHWECEHCWEELKKKWGGEERWLT